MRSVIGPVAVLDLPAKACVIFCIFFHISFFFSFFHAVFIG